jgi:hypothetical protein
VGRMNSGGASRLGLNWPILKMKKRNYVDGWDSGGARI